MASVIIPVAGTGKRFAAGQPKQFLPLAGKPVVVRTVERFLAHPEIEAGVIVAARSQMEYTKQLLEELPGFAGKFVVLAGGEERQDSVYNGLQAVKNKTGIVLVHDGVRPLVSTALIDAVISAAENNGAAIAAVPAKDTVKIVKDGKVIGTPDRSEMWLVQTPQASLVEWLKDAHERARQDGYYTTDESALLEWAGYPVSVVMGEYGNIKITTPEDLRIAETFTGTHR